MSGAVFLGTTTLKRMLKAVSSKYDPLYKQQQYHACTAAFIRVKEDPIVGDDVVYVYYHLESDTTIMTDVEGDSLGDEGASAAFRGKVECGLIRK